MKSIFLLLCSLMLTVSGITQHRILDGFVIEQTSSGVSLKIIISGGESCNGINIYRGIDSSEVEKIGRIPGLCGGGEDPLPYFFTDESPLKNQLVYYRAELGSQGFTEAQAFTCIDFSKELLIYPNPAKHQINVNAQLNEQSSNTLMIVDAQGRMKMTYNTTQEQTPISISALANGTYWVLLKKDGVFFSQAFIKCSE